MIEETEVDNSFTYKLENFEGPLDLLLEIIKKNKFLMTRRKIVRIVMF